MNATLNRPNRVLQIAAATLSLVAFADALRADIFQWEYVNSADPSQGKRQSTTLAPDGAGIDVVPAADLSFRDLTMANLVGADLMDSYAVQTDLTDAELSQSNLSNAFFTQATLTGVNFSDAQIRGADFGRFRCGSLADLYCGPAGTGVTPAQLYSTESYKTHDLSAVGFAGNDLAGGNFTGQNLSDATFYGATLTGADFTDADVQGTSFGKRLDLVYFFSSTRWVISGTGVTPSQLYSTANYQVRDLGGIDLAYNDLAGGNFAGQDLTNASFGAAELTGADFTGAEVRGANFVHGDVCPIVFSCRRQGGLTLEQLYSTASYQAKDLSGINLYRNNLAGANLAGQNLTDAIFQQATLKSADARGAIGLELFYTATDNLIRPNGHIAGLDLDADGLLVVRDYDGRFHDPTLRIPITVDEHLAMGPGGTLRMVFEADAWDSTISFAPGIPVTLGGTLELTFANDVNFASQIGRTFNLFDWTGVNPTGTFAISSPYAWDLSNLYTTGEVTLTTVPEPNTLLLTSVAFVALLALRRCNRRLQISAAMSCVVNLAFAAHADIFHWEYINPADPSQGKQQSTTLCPGGTGVDAVPGASLGGRNLTMAYLIGADLTSADALYANLTNADLSQANLTNAYFWGATLTSANFREANLTHVNLSAATLTSADFREANLTNAYFEYAILSGADFRQANLTNAYFYEATLTGANFADQELASVNVLYATLTDADLTGAQVRSANFNRDPRDPVHGGTGITVAQLYTTASYQAHDLTGISLNGNNLAGANFAGQNLTNANFYSATLTGADFTGAEVRGASFSNYDYRGGTGISLAQLYSTASYQAHDFTGIGLAGNDLSDGNFAGQDLTNAYFYSATLTGADFGDAILSNANFDAATLTGADFRDADLTNTDFAGSTLTHADFAGQNLSEANFSAATLTGADLSGADVRGATFSTYHSYYYNVTGSGLALSQLYSTASYQTHDLTGISLYGNNLTGANFAGQNLTNASFTGATLTGADFTDAEVRGAEFSFSTSGFTAAQLYSTASYQTHDLTGMRLGGDLSGWNFAGQNLTNANFGNATLTGADFIDAEVRGASFLAGGAGLTTAQLYSTASYQAQNLTGVHLGGDLSGWNFAGQNFTNADFGRANLTGANFREANLANAIFFGFRPSCYDFFSCMVIATLTDADLTAADARGAVAFLNLPASAITTNLIRPDGHINGLDLHAGGQLVVRDYDGPSYDPTLPIPITIDQHLAMGPGGMLRMVFEADAWDSTISFAPGIPVTLGGTLEITFADDVNLASQVGRTFDLFDWTGVTPTGAFAVASPYVWDLSSLYATGEVTLTAIPEPSCLVLAAMSAFGITFYRRRRIA